MLDHEIATAAIDCAGLRNAIPSVLSRFVELFNRDDAIKADAVSDLAPSLPGPAHIVRMHID
jgi:hypothetical protein